MVPPPPLRGKKRRDYSKIPMTFTTWNNPSLRRRIWAITWPATLSNISVPLLGLVDAAILGHLDTPNYLGAVAVGAAVLSFLYWGFSFLRMGTTGLIAQAYGAGDVRRDKQVLGQSLILALVLGCCVLALHPILLAIGLSLMAPGAELGHLANSYLQIRIFSAPAVLTTYAVTGWFIGRHNTRWPMVFVVITNVLNACLDLLFIVGLGMNSDGAALATLVAEYCGCAMALAAMWHHSGYRLDREWLRMLSRAGEYRELLVTNRHLFFRTLCLMFGFAFFTAKSSHFGPETLAANTILLNLMMLAAYGLDGLAHAAEALCGSAVGARKLNNFYQSCLALAFWTTALALGISAVFLAGGPYLLPLLTDLVEVRALFPEYYLWLVALPLVSAASYLLDGIFIGTGQTRYMYYSMMIATFGVYLPVWFFTQDMWNHGLWLAFLLFNGARGVGLGIAFWHLRRREDWLDEPQSVV